jgi:hypothetical protein
MPPAPQLRMNRAGSNVTKMKGLCGKIGARVAERLWDSGLRVVSLGGFIVKHEQ